MRWREISLRSLSCSFFVTSLLATSFARQGNIQRGVLFLIYSTFKRTGILFGNFFAAFALRLGLVCEEIFHQIYRFHFTLCVRKMVTSFAQTELLKNRRNAECFSWLEKVSSYFMKFSASLSCGFPGRALTTLIPQKSPSLKCVSWPPRKAMKKTLKCLKTAETKFPNKSSNIKRTCEKHPKLGKNGA